MVLTSDTYARPGHQQETYIVQESYGYPQTGYPYSTPVGTGYNSVPYTHNQYQQQQPVGDFYSRPHGHSYDHGPHGHNYDHNQNHNHNHGHKYQHQNQHGLTTYSAANMGFGGNQCPSMGHGYGPSHATGPGKYGKLYSAYKEADD